MKMLAALTICIISSAGTLLSMDGDKPRLWFGLDENIKIVSWNSHKMDFYKTNPVDFKDRVITDVLPLSNEKKREINEAFLDACNDGKPHCVTYDLKNESYKAKIVPMQYALWGVIDKKYFVTVRPEVKKN